MRLLQVSPYEIAFLPNSDSFSLTLMNHLVTVVFAVGMVCSFFIPYREPLEGRPPDQRPQKDRRAIPLDVVHLRPPLDPPPGFNGHGRGGQWR